MQRVVVGMSGGVDSSLAAVLLAEAGCEVVGVTMKLWPCAETDGGFTREDACCSPTEVVDARAVAVATGLAHFVVDFEAEFQRAVVDDFLAGYARGETPNPCVRCNESIKFGDLQAQAARLGAEAVGTGHYAISEQVDGRWLLATAADRLKDQTYFLFSLTQEQLATARFPLGRLRKDEVRAMAAERGLVTAAKGESQDICFIGREGTAGFLRRHIPAAFRPGPIVHLDGRPLGRHQGLAAFTIGQRKGHGVAWSQPLFVVRTEPETDTLVLGERDHLLVDQAWLRDCTWHPGPLPASGLAVAMRNRYRARPVPARVFAAGEGRARVVYDAPVVRPSPGQAGVAYSRDDRYCLGGGWFSAPENR